MMTPEPRLFPLPVAAFSVTAYAGREGWLVLVRLAGAADALPRTESVRYGPFTPEEMLDAVGAIFDSVEPVATAE